MGEHRTSGSKVIIESLVKLARALEYHVEREWKLPDTAPHSERADIALFLNAQSPRPAFILEVESSDGAPAVSNAVKYFGKQTTHLVKPFFLYHLFLKTSENGHRIRNLSAQYDKLNYKAYDFGADSDRQQFLRDMIAHHAVLNTSLNVESVAEALDDPAWDSIDPADVMETLAREFGLELLTLSAMARTSVRSRRFSSALSWVIRRPIAELSVGPLSFAGQMFAWPLLRGLRAFVAGSEGEVRAEYDALRSWQSEPEVIFNSELAMLGLSQDFDYAVAELSPPLFCLVAMLFARYEKGAQEFCQQLLTRATRSNLTSIWSRYALAWCVIASLRVGAHAIAHEALAEINRLGGLPLDAIPLLVPPIYTDDKPCPWLKLMEHESCEEVSFEEFRSRLAAVPRNASSLPHLVAEVLVNDEAPLILNERIICATPC